MEPLGLIILCVIVFAAAILGGMMGGAFLIILPAMILFGMNVHEVIGTSKLLMIAIGLSSIVYFKNKEIKLKSSLLFVIPYIVGIVFGSFVVIEISEAVLKNIIAILTIIIAFIILQEKNLGIKEKKIKLTNARKILFVLVALVVGIYSGFYAAGDSIFVVVLFATFAGTTFLEGVGNARIMDVVAGVVGLLIFHNFGVVNYEIGIWLAAACLIGGFVGAKIAIAAGNKWLRRLLFVVTIVMAIKLLFFM